MYAIAVRVTVLKRLLPELKVTMSRDLQPFSLLKRFELGPIWTGKHRFREQFRFHEDISSQSSKIRCLQRRHGHAHFSLYAIRRFSIILNCCCWGCKHTQVPFSPDGSFKICMRLQSFLCAQTVYCIVFEFKQSDLHYEPAEHKKVKFLLSFLLQPSSKELT